MQRTVTMVLTIVMITVAIAEMMVSMIPPIVETTEPCENAIGLVPEFTEYPGRM